MFYCHDQTDRNERISVCHEKYFNHERSFDIYNISEDLEQRAQQGCWITSLNRLWNC